MNADPNLFIHLVCKSPRDESGEHQVALVYFDRESAAKTAILLTNGTPQFRTL